MHINKYFPHILAYLENQEEKTIFFTDIDRVY